VVHVVTVVVMGTTRQGLKQLVDKLSHHTLVSRIVRGYGCSTSYQYSSSSSTSSSSSRMEMDTTAGTKKTRDLRKKSVVDLTEAASERIKVLLEKRKQSGDHKGADEYIRLGVKRRGCNGLAYTLNYDVEKKRFDEEIQMDGVRMLIDAGAVMHVLGTRMDYVEDDVRSEFVFINPNASGTCGCGESFTTASDEFAG
jgi:iron-sulfur cluster assembly 1